jgi:hypothetical protein
VVDCSPPTPGQARCSGFALTKENEPHGFNKRVEAMKANNFEYGHQTLVHLMIVAVAFLTYLVDRDDIVWRFVKDSTAPRTWERSLFLIATLALAVGAGLCTWARALPKRNISPGLGQNRDLRRPRYLGELSFAIGLASLAPLWGFVILVAGEALRLFRLMRREDDQAPASSPQANSKARWGRALRQEVGKWAMLLTMIVFVITLKDRLAEVLAAASLLTGLLLNAPFFTPPLNQVGK